jgi:hypothetical protein
MKRIVYSSLATTALILLAISILDYIWKINYIYSNTVSEVFVTSIMIHGVRKLLDKFHSKHYLFEMAADFIAVLVVVLACSYYFQWIYFTGPFIMIGMVLVVYMVYTFLDVSKARRDVMSINKSLQIRNEMRRRQDEQKKL